MEQCPNCKKKAVEKDQCLACGIVVSRWLKLHSAIPPETSRKDEEESPVYPHLPLGMDLRKRSKTASGTERASTQIKDDDGLNLEPPDFLIDKDATIPISEGTGVPAKGTPAEPHRLQSGAHFNRGGKNINEEPANPNIVAPSGVKKESPAEHQAEGSAKDKQPSFFAQTEADITRLKRDLKTDWAGYYATRKERYLSDRQDYNITTRFRIRNMLISIPLMLVALLSADIKFLLRFGITAEYSTLQPFAMMLGFVAFLVALSALVTLKPVSIKTRKGEGDRVKILLHPLQFIEILLLISLLFLLPLRPAFDVDSKSEFPIASESGMKIDFLTGEGLGNFIRPVLGPDGKTIYSVQLYGQNTGFIVRLKDEGGYVPFIQGIKITKFRFQNKSTIIFQQSGGLYRLKTTKTAGSSEETPAAEIILNGFTASDFDISPDGRKLIFCSGGDIYLSEEPFDTAENITDTPEYMDGMPSFFPDGGGFLYISDIYPGSAEVSEKTNTEEWFDEMYIANVKKPQKCLQLFEYRFGKESSRRITDDDNNYMYPLYSKNMSKIAVVVEVMSNIALQTGPISLFEKAVVIMNPDGTGKVRIFPPLDMPLRAMHEMCWYPDDKTLLLGINAVLQKGIYKISF